MSEENTEIETEENTNTETELKVELPDEIKEEIEADKEVEEKNDDPADKEEAEDDKEVDPDKAATDIVFPEDSVLNEEQQSELSEILGSQENYDKIITMLQNISSEQIAKDEAGAVATAEAKSKANEESLKKDADFGKDYEANVKGVQDLAKELGMDEAVDTMDPTIAKGLLKIVSERADANIHIENKTNVPTGPKKDIYGNSMMDVSQTMSDLEGKEKE